MRRFSFEVFFCLSLIFALQNLYSQSAPCYPESNISYDLQKQSFAEKTVIPFDRAFTLSIDKVLTKNVEYVYVYQTEMHKGQLELKETCIYDCGATSRSKQMLRDLILKPNPNSETLQVCFPALKPNVTFSLHIVTKLAPECNKKLMEINSKLAQSQGITTEYASFEKCTVENMSEPHYMNLNEAAYKLFFNANLKASYTTASSAGTYTTATTIAVTSINALVSVNSRDVTEYSDGQYLQEVSRNSNTFKEMLLGLRDIKKVFGEDKDVLVDMFALETREQNLINNLKLFDDADRRITQAISRGIITRTINGAPITLATVKTEIEKVRDEIRSNLAKLQTELKAINSEILKNDELKQVILVNGNSQSIDLKAAGGNILFLDAGFANILAKNLNNQNVYIPKLYFGVSIYFRPIDKNTRREKFGCLKPIGCKTVDCVNQYGPDYGVASTWSIWQHLSLNLGVTLGSMTNKDFDNFYSSNSLLIGPAYRFKRAFKVSAGVALLKRSSKNPLFSEKEIIPAAYLSLSVDIDFIDTIKSVTSMFFK